MPEEERLEGHVVDIICLRHYSPNEYGSRAREHTSACALEGHCVESGYALVTEDGVALLLDEAATPRVVAAVLASDRDRGIRLSVERRQKDGRMATTRVEEVEEPDGLAP